MFEFSRVFLDPSSLSIPFSFSVQNGVHLKLIEERALVFYLRARGAYLAKSFLLLITSYSQNYQTLFPLANDRSSISRRICR